MGIVRCGVEYNINKKPFPPKHGRAMVRYWDTIIFFTSIDVAERYRGRLPYHKQEDSFAGSTSRRLS